VKGRKKKREKVAENLMKRPKMEGKKQEEIGKEKSASRAVACTGQPFQVTYFMQQGLG
jgi:hypothetical protein